jgi:hypothetical protein
MEKLTSLKKILGRPLNVVIYLLVLAIFGYSLYRILTYFNVLPNLLG